MPDEKYMNLINRARRFKKPEESDDDLRNRALMGLIISGEEVREEVREARTRLDMAYNKKKFLQSSKRASTLQRSHKKARKKSG